MPAVADEVRLKSGDRITGTVIQLADGTLEVDAPYGKLSIAWPEVVSLSVEGPIQVRAADGQSTTHTGGAIEIGPIVALTRPAPPLAWNGGGNVGFVATGGNTDVNSLRVDTEVVARTPHNRYTAALSTNRAEDGGRETSRNASVSARYDRFLTPHLFLNANAIFTNDRFRDLDLRTALGAGIGYQFLDSSLARLSVDGGFGYVDEHFRSSLDNHYTAVRETARLDILLVTDRLTLFHQHDGYFGVTGDDNLFIKTQNGIRLRLIAGFVTTAQLDLDYDRSPAPERRQTDRTFALTFGYRF